jgi:hypothetical protein
MKQDEGWGSCPVQGRDWGNSYTCDEPVIDALVAQFEESGRRAGTSTRDCEAACSLYFFTFPHLFDALSSLPFIPGVRDSFGSSPSKEGPTHRIGRSANLAFDMEENIILEQDSQLDGTLQSQQDDEENEKKLRRRKVSYAKHKRMSLWASTAQAGAPLLSQQKPLFRTMKSLARVDESKRQSLLRHEEFPLVNNADCQLLEDTSTAALTNEAVLSAIFSCLNESELLSKVSLVCTAWSDAATSAHASLMMTSVGYVEPSDDIDDELDEAEVFDCSEKPMQSVALSMQRSWQYLNTLYPWGCFLSEGAFKRVYKVHNSRVGVDEALSVM